MTNFPWYLLLNEWFNCWWLAYQGKEDKLRNTGFKDWSTSVETFFLNNLARKAGRSVDTSLYRSYTDRFGTWHQNDWLMASSVMFTLESASWKRWIGWTVLTTLLKIQLYKAAAASVKLGFCSARSWQKRRKSVRSDIVSYVN